MTHLWGFFFLLRQVTSLLQNILPWKGYKFYPMFSFLQTGCLTWLKRSVYHQRHPGKGPFVAATHWASGTRSFHKAGSPFPVDGIVSYGVSSRYHPPFSYFHYTSNHVHTAHVVSRCLPTAADSVRARVWAWGICGEQRCIAPGFIRVLRFSFSLFIPPIAPQSPTSITWGCYNRPVLAAVTNGLKSHPDNNNNNNNNNDILFIYVQ
jgi:hypothetical protein